MENISFESFKKLIQGDEKNRVIKNFGMDPKLGKYNRTYCDDCSSLSEIVETEIKNKKYNVCKKCGSKNITKGVLDRIEEITTNTSKSLEKRAEYVYQVPIEFLPKIGKKTLEKLLDHYGTEMNILHKAKISDIEQNFRKAYS